jgi:tRNA nucleotidyltransferase (CCA-adding enzyme)
MQKYEKIFKSVLKKIKPSSEQKKQLDNLSKKAMGLVNEKAKKYKAKAMLVGSITRDTWLPDKKEFDIFILFPPNLKDEKMEELGLEIGKSVISALKGKHTIEYAEHPYVSGLVDGIDIDIVPCFEVECTEKMKSAVDRTPFHVRYIEKNLSLKLSDEVRLLKQFLKVNELYGADAKTLGFSGYVNELLIIKYRSFLNVLKAISDWNPGEVIDIEKFYKKDDYQRLRKEYKNQVLVLIDPTDKKRNAAAALSPENFFKFKKVAKLFLAKPREDLFFHKKLESLTERELIELQAKRRTELIFVKFTPPNVVPDILYPQIRRFGERLQNILEETDYEFKVLRRDTYTNEKDLALILLEMEISKLPIIQKRVGPKVFDSDDSKRFVEKYKELNPFVEGDNWVVEIRRRFLTAREKLKDSLMESIDILKAKGIPNYIAAQIAKGFEIFSENDRIMELVNKNNNFGVFLRKYFEKESLI